MPYSDTLDVRLTNRDEDRLTLLVFLHDDVLRHTGPAVLDDELV